MDAIENVGSESGPESPPPSAAPAPDPLAEIRKRLDDLSEKVMKPPKDRWDKLTAMSGVLAPVLSAGIVAGIGFYATNVYNHRALTAEENRKAQELKITEVQTVEKFIPHLASKDQSEKSAALILISELGNQELALKLAAAFPGPGATSAVTAIAATGSPQVAAAANKALSEIYRDLRSQVVTLIQHGEEGDSIIGMGSIVGRRDIVAVAAHSLNSHSEMTVRLADGTITQGKPVYTDASDDIAFLKLQQPGTSATPLEPSETPPPVASRVSVLVNYPEQAGFVAVGTVTTPTSSKYISMDVETHVGASGAPVVNDEGKLIGMVVRGDAGSKTFAVPAQTILELLKKIPP